MVAELGQHFVWAAAPTSAMGEQLLPLLHGCCRLCICRYTALLLGEIKIKTTNEDEYKINAT